MSKAVGSLERCFGIADETIGTEDLNLNNQFFICLLETTNIKTLLSPQLNYPQISIYAVAQYNVAEAVRETIYSQQYFYFVHLHPTELTVG